MCVYITLPDTIHTSTLYTLITGNGYNCTVRRYHYIWFSGCQLKLNSLLSLHYCCGEDGDADTSSCISAHQRQAAIECFIVHTLWGAKGNSLLHTVKWTATITRNALSCAPYISLGSKELVAVYLSLPVAVPPTIAMEAVASRSSMLSTTTHTITLPVASDVM